MSVSRILDTVDLFLGGENVAARAGPDAVFCLTRDLLTAVRDVTLRRREKAVVSFYEGPWEVVLLREGDQILLSFLRVGPAPEVVVQDYAVPREMAASAVVAAGDELIRCVRRLERPLRRDPLVDEIDLLGAQVRGALLALLPAEEARPPETQRVRSRHYDEPLSGGLSLAFELTASSRDLLGPVIKGRADLHGLLARGTLLARAGDTQLVGGPGRVFLQVERLLGGLRQLLAAWEKGQAMHVRLHGDTLQVGLRLTAQDKVALTLGQANGERRALAVADLPVEEVAVALLTLGQELRRAVKAVAPRQRHNPRFDAFRRELATLESWYRDLTRPALVAENAIPFRVDQGADEESASPVSLSQARRLSYLERWWLEAEGLDTKGTFLCGDRVVVTARNTVMALDRDRGELLWRVETPQAYSVMAGPFGLVRLEPSGRASLMDLRDGRTRWEVALRPRAGLPAGLQVGGSHGPRSVVLSEGERGLVALDLNTGEQRWRFSAWRGRDFSLRPARQLLLVTCGDSAVYALDADSGELQWRLTARATFGLPAVAVGDRVVTCAGRGGGRSARLYCADLASGRLQWVASLDAGLAGAPVGAGRDHLVVPARHASGGALVLGLDLTTGQERWRRWLEGWGAFALLSVDDFVVACGAGGVVAAIDGGTGGLNWCRNFGSVDPDDVPRRLEPVLRGGALFVPADTVYVMNPREGTVIHSLGGESLVPDLLRVDERCGVYVAEESGYMAAYGVATKLSVVQ
jgi:outer membrane protein assembly factor BamB